MLELIGLAAFSYLLGSIPTAYIAGKLKSDVDIRKKGSGNVGATNALVIIGPLFGIAVYIVDLLKGLIPVLLAKHYIGTDLSMGLCGLCAVLGHDFSVFLAFTGGKGVATTTGAVFGINSLVMWIIVLLWFVVLVPITNQFILSSLICLALIPILMFVFKLSWTLVIFGALYFLVGLFTHRQDIVRIARREEPRAFDSIKKYLKK
jgi:glycerol-3-phosphate acyltransferase PlsY